MPTTSHVDEPNVIEKIRMAINSGSIDPQIKTVYQKIITLYDGNSHMRYLILKNLLAIHSRAENMKLKVAQKRLALAKPDIESIKDKDVIERIAKQLSPQNNSEYTFRASAEWTEELRKKFKCGIWKNRALAIMLILGIAGLTQSVNTILHWGWPYPLCNGDINITKEYAGQPPFYDFYKCDKNPAMVTLDWIFILWPIPILFCFYISFRELAALDLEKSESPYSCYKFYKNQSLLNDFFKEEPKANENEDASENDSFLNRAHPL